MPINDRITTPLQGVIAFAQQDFTTATNGITIPLKGLVSLAWFFVSTAWTSGTMTFKVQVSDDDSAWVDLDEKYVIRPSTVSITAASQVRKIGISGVDTEGRKYARLVTIGTVVLSGNCIAITEPDQR
jgi:hypothetical protein